MAVVTLTATQRPSESIGTGMIGVKVLCSTIEVGAADTVASTYTFGQIPSNARLLGISHVGIDDVGAATTAIKIGLFGDNITDDDDALNASIALTTASNILQVLTDPSKWGKYAWEFVANQTVDPTEPLTVKATVITADTDAAGTVTLELYYLA